MQHTFFHLIEYQCIGLESTNRNPISKETAPYLVTLFQSIGSKNQFVPRFGNIIANDWILIVPTFLRSPGFPIPSPGRVIGNVTVCVGLGLTNFDECRYPGIIHKVKRIIYSSKYLPNEHYGDLALLELEKPIEYNRFARPIKLYNYGENVQVGENVKLIGPVYDQDLELYHFTSFVTNATVIKAESCWNRTDFSKLFHKKDNKDCNFLDIKDKNGYFCIGFQFNQLSSIIINERLAGLAFGVYFNECYMLSPRPGVPKDLEDDQINLDVAYYRPWIEKYVSLNLPEEDYYNNYV